MSTKPQTPEINPQDMVTDWALALDPGGQPIIRAYRRDSTDRWATAYGTWTELISPRMFGRTPDEMMAAIVKSWRDTEIIDIRFQGREFRFTAKEASGWEAQFRVVI